MTDKQRTASTCPNKNAMLTQLYRIYDAQVESKQQANEGLSQQQIQDITIKKEVKAYCFTEQLMNLN
jgi:hypothetical protein